MERSIQRTSRSCSTPGACVRGERGNGQARRTRSGSPLRRLGGLAAPDCNANCKIDSCDIAQGPATDIDANGIPATCQGGCNGNTLPDTYEITLSPSKDCDSDGVLDTCEIAAGAQDKDVDGVLDDCEYARGDFDLSGEINGADLTILLANWGMY